MSTVGIKSRRIHTDFALKLAVDTALVNIALMGGFMFHRIWVEHKLPSVQQGDSSRYVLITGLFLLISAMPRLLAQIPEPKRALESLPTVLGTFSLYGVLTVLFPARFGEPLSVLATSTGLGLLFIVGTRMKTVAADKTTQPARTSLFPEKRIKKVLVIGGAGHVGAVLVPKLLERGYTVRVLDRLAFGAGSLESCRSNRRFQLIQGDFRDLHVVVRAMSGVDAVVHLGAVLSDPDYCGDEDRLMETNLIASRLIASCAKAVNVRRFVYASSCAVYGTQDGVYDEESETAPETLFARIKAESEAEIRRLCGNRLQPTIIRFGTVFGIGENSRFDLVVNFLASAARMPGKVTLHSREHRRPFIHVADAADAVVLVLDSKCAVVRGHVFNVGSEDQCRTLDELASTIRKVAPTANVEVESESTGGSRHLVQFSKIRSQLGFQPSWTIEAGIKQIVDRTEPDQPFQGTIGMPAKADLMTDEMVLQFVAGETPALRCFGDQTMLY